MATSAEKLSTILDLALTMARDGEENEAIMKALAKRELLPAKLLPKKKEATSIFASKQAEEVATRAHLASLEPGAGSGKDGRYTLADINKLLETPKKKPTAISPSALQLANEKGISISGVVGSGKDGRIVLKDIESLLEQDAEEDELNISPRALNEANEAKIPQSKLRTLHGSGKDGRIILSDIEKLKSEDDSSSSEEESSDEEDEPPARHKSDKKKSKK